MAKRAEQLGGGRAASRLSAYALLVVDRPLNAERAVQDLDALANQTEDRVLAMVLREAAEVVRNVETGEQKS